MIVTGHFRAGIVSNRLVAEDDPGDLDFLFELAAAIIGEAGVMIADDPGPVDARGQRLEQVARVRGKTVTAEAVMETVAKAEEARCAGR